MGSVALPLAVFAVAALAVVALAAQNAISVRSGNGASPQSVRRQALVVGWTIAVLGVIAAVSLITAGTGILAVGPLPLVAVGLLIVQRSRAIRE